MSANTRLRGGAIYFLVSAYMCWPLLTSGGSHNQRRPRLLRQNTECADEVRMRLNEFTGNSASQLIRRLRSIPRCVSRWVAGTASPLAPRNMRRPELVRRSSERRQGSSEESPVEDVVCGLNYSRSGVDSEWQRNSRQDSD